MGNAQASQAAAIAVETDNNKLSLLRRRVSTLDTRSSKRSTSSERWRAKETQSSKRFARLGSIRRKLVRRTRKGSDYRKQIRDLLSPWSIKEIQSFIREYDALDSLRELRRLSDTARIKSPNLKSDIANLYEHQYCSDLKLDFKGSTFLVHKAILCARCSFFTTYLAASESGATVTVEEQDFEYSTSLFSSLLRYIYSGYTKDKKLIEILSTLGEKFGMLKSLDDSMREALEDVTYADLILAFPGNNSHTPLEGGEEQTVDNTFEVCCHSSILCARSAFFRSLINERNKKTTMTTTTERSSLPYHNLHVNNNNSKSSTSSRIRLVLSETIIPRTYIKVILHCMYTDCLDLSSVIKWKVADDGSGEADRLLTPVELAMELFEIGRFLEFPILMKQCEDMIVENFNVTTLIFVLDWSWQPSGSKFVYRQAMDYFSEEFVTLCKTPVFLANIPKRFLLSVIKSDFLQANEEFILSTVVRWGEWQITKANEKTGPSPINSLPRRSPKRRDINNEVLRDLIADLLPHVRLKHILPPSSPVLQSTYQRGLIQHPFPFEFASSGKGLLTVMFWLQEYRHADYTRPRLFSPYVDEVKLVLHERLTAERESCHSSSSSSSNTLPSHCHIMPDMLTCNFTSERKAVAKKPFGQHGGGGGGCETPTSTAGGVATLSSCIMDINDLGSALMTKMVLREKELKTSPEVLRALALAPDNAEISRELELRVIREFGLPDELSAQIFKQIPDLIEFDSSSGSSKQSTLSKVGILMSCGQQQSASLHCPSHDNNAMASHESNAVMHIPVTDSGMKSVGLLPDHHRNSKEEGPYCFITDRTTLTLDLSPDLTYFSSSAASPSPDFPMRSIEDSPLDLPTHGLLPSLEAQQLPNVLLDT